MPVALLNYYLHWPYSDIIYGWNRVTSRACVEDEVGRAWWALCVWAGAPRRMSGPRELVMLLTESGRVRNTWQREPRRGELGSCSCPHGGHRRSNAESTRPKQCPRELGPVLQV